MSFSGLIEKFRTVAVERLERMHADLDRLEEAAPSEPARQALLREAHTLKGEARMLGFVDVNLVAHLTEQVLLDGDDSAQAVALVRSGLETMRAMLTKSPGNFSAPIDLTGFVERVYARGGAIEHQTPHVAPPSAAQEEPTQQLRIVQASSLRVDLSQLEFLGESSGELVLLTRRLDYQLEQLRRQTAALERFSKETALNLPKSHQAKFREALHGFEVLAAQMREELQQAGIRAGQVDESARTLRHVPIADVLSHYPHAVREIADAVGKRVRFSHAYGDVKIDRTILSGMSDPLLHLIRNAIDHGIEAPHEREALGKDPVGEVRIEAEHSGDAVRVTLRDDGRGIDAANLRARAVARGFLSDDDANTLSDDEALRLIFRHGFSTRDQVSDLSGRGIGMDVVRREVAQLGGTVDITSQPGVGTTFRLTIPVSSAVSTVLLVLASGQRFALPAKSVERVVVTEPGQIRAARRGWEAEFEGTLVPVVDFSTVLGLSPRPLREGRLSLLVMHHGARRVAAWVDEVIGEREAISRSLGGFLAGVQTCRGIALTDSGDVVPILNVDVALERVRAPKRQESLRTTASIQTPVALRTVLVVEDSEITRTLVTGILKGLGLRVIEAEDGSQAVKKLNDHRVDLVVSDVQMPGMSGLDLLEYIRKQPKTCDVPVVMLTTLNAAEDRERAMKLGADGYLTKLNFQEKDLIRIVQRYLGV